MSGGLKKKTIVVLAGLFLSESLHAVEEVYRGPALLASIDAVHTRPQPKPQENLLEPEDQFYREYFSANDASVKQSHEDSFRYHQEQVRYAATSWKGEYLTMGTLDTYGRAPLERDIRDSLARSVFNGRIRLAIHSFLASEKRPKVIRSNYRRLSDTLEKAKNVAFDVTEQESGRRSELRCGYDFFSDAGKVEYTSAFADAGLYHPALSAALTGGAPLFQVISLSVSPVTPEGLPRPSFGYTLFGDSISTGLSRQFGDVSTSIVRTTPIRGDAPSRYDLRLGMSF